MMLKLVREKSRGDATLGRLFVNNVFQCYTLEDVVREVKGKPVSAWKLARKTAIPSGSYTVTLNMSNRFKRVMPLLLEVPGFAGVRIHAGNSAADTEGCLIVGASRVGYSRVGQSRLAYDRLMALLTAATSRKEKLVIEVVNPSAT
jgi:hypothetical protein